jgi:hypothetical protein
MFYVFMVYELDAECSFCRVGAWVGQRPPPLRKSAPAQALLAIYIIF